MAPELTWCFGGAASAGADATDFALPPSVDANLKAYWRRYHAIKVRLSDAQSPLLSHEPTR